MESLCPIVGRGAEANQEPEAAPGNLPPLGSSEKWTDPTLRYNSGSHGLPTQLHSRPL